MKTSNKITAALLSAGLLLTVALAVSGCKKDEAPAPAAAEHPSVGKAQEHPAAQPAQENPAAAKPKDHPTH